VVVVEVEEVEVEVVERRKESNPSK